MTCYRRPEGLKSRKEFLRVQRGGRRFKGRLMVLIIAPGNEGVLDRVGYTVSRKVGNAVIRNKVKRRMREIVRLAPGALLSAHDHVFILFSEAADSTYVALEREALCLLSRARQHMLPGSLSE